MVPSPELLLVLSTLVACDVATATREPAPTAVLAADGPASAPQRPRAELRREARRAAKPSHSELAPTTASPPARAPASLPACAPDEVLGYRSFGDGFLRTWCTGCHSSTLAAADRQGAPEAVDFDRYELYKPHERQVYERAVLEAHALTVDPAAASPMPPAGVVPQADRDRLARWIACGSPRP